MSGVWSPRISKSPFLKVLEKKVWIIEVGITLTDPGHDSSCGGHMATGELYGYPGYAGQTASILPPH